MSQVDVTSMSDLESIVKSQGRVRLGRVEDQVSRWNGVSIEGWILIQGQD